MARKGCAQYGRSNGVVTGTHVQTGLCHGQAIASLLLKKNPPPPRVGQRPKKFCAPKVGLKFPAP